MNDLNRLQVAAVVVALGALADQHAEARERTEQNKAELVNVPAWWSTARLCYQEGGAGESGPRVVVGVDGREETSPRVLAIRPESPEGLLPEYVRTGSGPAPGKQVSVPQSGSVGFTDDFYEVFVLPNGVRLTCEALPGR